MANANHLLIGLGGTGGKIIRSLRKAIFQRFRGEQPKGANLRHLYIESSDEMMKHDDLTWRILGQSVQLPLSGQLLISGLNLAGVLDYIGSYPGIAPWIGNREAFRESRGIGSVQSLEEPDTGVSSLYLMLKDHRGLDREPMRLGKDFAEAWANPNAEAEDALAISVTHALGAEFLHQAKREELMSEAIAEVEAIKAERKHPLDKAVRAYSDAARIADTILQRR